MKYLKFFILLSAIITIGYFSWSYYGGRSLREKYERATLVFENLIWRDLYAYEQKIQAIEKCT